MIIIKKTQKTSAKNEHINYLTDSKKKPKKAQIFRSSSSAQLPERERERNRALKPGQQWKKAEGKGPLGLGLKIYEASEVSTAISERILLSLVMWQMRP